MGRVRTRNVGRILRSADRKLGDRAESSGGVPLRVAGAIIEEGSYCEDQVVGEYLGGVLASSNTDVGRDDRGTRWVKLITSLSAYDIRLHYLLYSALRGALTRRNKRVPWGNEQSYGDLRVLLSYDDVVNAMEFSADEDPELIISEAHFAIAREGLSENFSQGPKEYIQTQIGRDCPFEGGIFFTPTTVGVQLYMWAQGLGPVWRNFDSQDQALPDIGVPTISALAIEELPPLTIKMPGERPSRGPRSWAVRS